MPSRKVQKTEQKKDRRIPTTRYNPDYKKGLTSQQVQEHRLHGWVNRSVEPPSKTTKEIIHENVFTYFNLIFIILAVLLCLVGSFRDLTFLPVIVANTLIGIIPVSYTHLHGTGRRKESGRDSGRAAEGERSPGGTAELIFLKFFSGKWLTEGKNML